jgi:hypothetical protein
MAKGARKGSSFERELCFQLSKWWTDGARDDIFRRSATSGGRATVRSKIGKRTAGQYGDIAIADPIGQPLIELATIELKTGYPGQSPFDLIDKSGIQNPTYLKFFQQCERERKEAKTPYWILIARRKQKVKMIYFPFALYRKLNMYDYFEGISKAHPYVRLHVFINSRWKKIFGCPLSEFIKLVSPEIIVKILKERKDK